VRLDRALVNPHWLLCFPESSVLHLHKLKSDHRSILLRTHNQVYSPTTKPFRFLSNWLSQASFKHVLNHKWKMSFELPFALRELTNDLSHWNKFVFGNIFRRKKRLLMKLDILKHNLTMLPSLSNLAKENWVRSDLEAVLWQEESLWL
ncbi:hypothetical protein LINPERHAP2_LOCUS19037, partial [Linum perenne]